MSNFFMGIGVSLVICGILHRRYKMAGYYFKKAVDKEGLANWTGSNLIIMGVMAILIGILAYVMSAVDDVIYIVGLIILIIIFIRAVMGCRRYEVK
ncbi:MAG: hypothetical protein APF81_01675 [Desulfosporosinus sp. BRH_c37]|nr:MAG: hypothetical protein APF81_01675 [Desulfosporosinus sp. BRH_c37]